MAVYDIVVLVILVAGVVRGAWKGFAWQLATILSLVGGYLIALPLSARLAPSFGSQAPLNRYLALTVCYISISLIVYVLMSLVRRKIQDLKLGEYDRHLGGVLGGVKSVVACLALTLALVTISDTTRNAIAASHSGRWAVVVLEGLHPIMPEGLSQVLHPYIDTLDEATAAETEPAAPRTRERRVPEAPADRPTARRSARPRAEDDEPELESARHVASSHRRGPSDPAGEPSDDDDAQEQTPARSERSSSLDSRSAQMGKPGDTFKRKILPRLLDEAADLIPRGPAPDRRSDRAN